MRLDSCTIGLNLEHDSTVTVSFSIQYTVQDGDQDVPWTLECLEATSSATRISYKEGQYGLKVADRQDTAENSSWKPDDPIVPELVIPEGTAVGSVGNHEFTHAFRREAMRLPDQQVEHLAFTVRMVAGGAMPSNPIICHCSADQHGDI
jgi:hypothetical protein